MAGRVLRKQEVADAVKTFCELHPEYQKSAGEHGFTLMPGDVLVSCSNEGKLEVKCPDANLQQTIYDKLIGILMDLAESAREAEQESEPKSKPKQERSNVPAPLNKSQGMAKPAPQVPDADLANYHRKKSTLYKTEDGAAPSAAMVNRSANSQSFCTDVLEYEVTDNTVRAHVRVTDPRTGQYQEDGVAFTKDAFVAKKTIDIIAKHIKKFPGLVESIDPISLRPILSETAMIYDLPARLFLAKEVLKSWNFLGRFAVTTAQRRCQDKLLNAEFREKEEIELERAEMADVAEGA